MRTATRLVFVPFLLAFPLSIGCSGIDSENDPAEPNDDDITAWNEAYEQNASGKADSAGPSSAFPDLRSIGRPYRAAPLGSR